MYKEFFSISTVKFSKDMADCHILQGKLEPPTLMAGALASCQRDLCLKLRKDEALARCMMKIFQGGQGW